LSFVGNPSKDRRRGVTPRHLLSSAEAEPECVPTTRASRTGNGTSSQQTCLHRASHQSSFWPGKDSPCARTSDSSGQDVQMGSSSWLRDISGKAWEISAKWVAILNCRLLLQLDPCWSVVFGLRSDFFTLQVVIPLSLRILSHIPKAFSHTSKVSPIGFPSLSSIMHEYFQSKLAN
jgi:hypothetical protein